MSGWSARDYPTPESTPSPPATIKQERAPSPDLIPASSSPDLKSSTTLPLPLEDDRKDQKKVDKQRTVPCEQCRKIRRACKWRITAGSEDWKRCERCRITGKDCSGPMRRTDPSLLEVVQVPNRRQRPISIGPSSPETRWSTVHLSYSLSYHLAETGLEHVGFIDQYGIDLPSFRDRLAQSGGRNSELGAIEELFCLGYQCFGMQLTDHSAVIGSDKATSRFSVVDDALDDANVPLNLGLVRTDALSCLTGKMLRQLAQTINQSTSLPISTDQLAVGLFLLEMTSYISGFDSERSNLVKALLSRGLETWRRTDRESEECWVLSEALTNIAMEDLRLAAITTHTVALPIVDCRILFADSAPPESLVAPDNLDFIYDVANEDPATLDIAVAFMSEWTPSLRNYHLDLIRILAYSPSINFASVIQYCWRKIDHSTEVVDSLIHRIFEDPRYDKIPQELKQFRPSARLSELVCYEVEAVPTLWGCHRMLRRHDAPSAILRESQQRLFKVLNLTAGRLAIFARSGASLGVRHLTLLPIVRAISCLSRQVLEDWASENPTQRDIFIEGLRFASYRLPAAARLDRRLQAEQDALPDHEKKVYTVQELRDMGDRAPEFVYTI